MATPTNAPPVQSLDTGTEAEEIVIGNPNIQLIPLDQLYVKSYQRKWSVEQSDRIAMSFSMEAFGVLHVLKMGDHSYEVLDGQHRFMALCRMGYDMTHTRVVCQVFEAAGEYAPNAPAIFVGLNSNRRPLKPVERLKARLEAGDEQALAVKQLLDDTGLELWTGSGRVPDGTIGAIVTLEGLMKRDGYGFTAHVLELIKSFWGGDQRAWRHATLVGVRHFLRHYQGRIHEDHLHAIMTQTDPGALLRRGQAITEAMGGAQLEYGVARAIAALYNEVLPHGAGVRRLPAWEVGSKRVRNVPRDEMRDVANRIPRENTGRGGAWQSSKPALAPIREPRVDIRQDN